MAKWCKPEAKQVLKQLSPLFKECGFKGRIVGSVAKKGCSDHDLDILLTVLPERKKADDFDIEPLIEKLNADPTMEYESLWVPWTEGRIIDLQFEGGSE